MNDELLDWTQFRGLDTEGLMIWQDLNRLAEGQINDSEEASELLCDLVRDRTPSTAGYAAVPFLLANSDNERIPLKLRLDMIHAACLILGLSSEPGVPEIPDCLLKNLSDENRKHALQKLFHLASKDDLDGPDVVCIASAALLVKGLPDAYDDLMRFL